MLIAAAAGVQPAPVRVGSRRGGGEARPGALDGDTQHLTVQCFVVSLRLTGVFGVGWRWRAPQHWYASQS